MRLTHRLFVLALVAVAPALFIEVYNEVVSRRAREAEVREQATRSALQAASELQQVIEGARHLLTAISQVESVRSFEPTSCVAYFSQLQPDVPNLLSLAAIDQAGWLRCRKELPSEPVSYADRPYIQKALSTGRFTLGEYTEARIAKRAVLPMALPLRSQEGATVGVVATAIDLQWLSERLLERGLPPEGSITVADRNGTIIARQPFPARFVGTRIPDPFQALLNSPSPGSTEVVSQDGTRRVIGYVPIPVSPDGFYVSVGLSSEASFEAIDRATRRGAVVLGIGTLVALLGAWLVGRLFIEKPVERMLHVANSWRAGDLSVRSNLTPQQGELGRLGEEFDHVVAELGQREQRQELLVNELNHRVKNTLATVQSIVAQSLRNAPTAEEARASIESRLFALSRAHDVLTRENWEGAGLRNILEEALAPYCGEQVKRVHLSGPDVQLAPRMALSLAMAVQELATNAVKYGALSNGEGQIGISWTTDPETDPVRLQIRWQEIGGPPVHPPTRRGFGTRLLERSLSHEVDGKVEIEFRPTGVVCTIEVPLASTGGERTLVGGS
jgi:two-component sensor histidine kinase